MSSDPGSMAITQTSIAVQRQDLFEKKGAGYAGWAQISLVLAVVLIFIGAYFQIFYYPEKKWIVAVWAVGLIFFIIFAYFVWAQHKLNECMKDPMHEGCLARIGQECQSV